MAKIARTPRKWPGCAFAAGLSLAALMGLSGCSSMIERVPTWAGGLPEGAPEQPAVQPAYPAVHDMPPPRNDTVLSDAERKKLKDDLNAMRTRTEADLPGAETTGSALSAGAAGKP